MPSVVGERDHPDFTRRQLEKNGIGINFSLGLDVDTDISSGDP